MQDTGGCTPLGYDLDSEKKLVINEHEAEESETAIHLSQQTKLFMLKMAVRK